MKVFVTGGSGYVGQHLLKRLIDSGHRPVCLIRRGAEAKLSDLRGDIEIVAGEIGAPEAWREEVEKIDAIINLIGIIREFPSRGITFQRLHVQAMETLIGLANEWGDRRFLQMSALGASPSSTAEYQRSKFRAEELLKASGLDWTIFRPSLILGSGNQALATMVKMIKSTPLVPVIGNGQYRLQPVDIDDLALAFVHALKDTRTIGQIYEIAGPEEITYNQLLDRIGAALGRKVNKLSVPAGMMKLIASPFEYFSFFPITRGQIEMLLEGNTADSRKFFADFGIKPIGLDESLRKALRIS